MEKIPSKIIDYLNRYSRKKSETALRLIISIRDNNRITIPEMADRIGTTDGTVQRYLKESQDNAILKRVGSDKNGEWVFMTEEELR